MISDLLRNNVILDQVRSKVSADRTRFKDSNTNLDLSYITDNLIAMGFPASGIEAAWRNHIDEVANMLDKYHGFENTLIFNLSDRKYNYEKFKNQIVEVGFPDHYSPPLHILFHIVLQINRWLTADPKHVAVVHCMGGKGRTGTVVVCWLLMVGVAPNALAAFEYFATRRSKIYKGVTQASQKRYVAYFEDVLRKRKPPKSKVYIITGIEISPVPLSNKKRTGCKLRLEVCSTHKYPEKVLWTTPFVRMYDASEQRIRLDQLHVAVAGDVLIRAAHVSNSGDKKKMFRIMFHTAFVQAGSATLRRADLDDLPKHKGAPEKNPIAADFQVVVHFANPDNSDWPPPADLAESDQDMEPLYKSLWAEASNASSQLALSIPAAGSSVSRSGCGSPPPRPTPATGLGDNYNTDTVRYGSPTQSNAIREVQQAVLVQMVQQRLAAGETVPDEVLAAAGIQPQPQYAHINSAGGRRSTALTPKWDMTTYTAPLKGKGPSGAAASPTASPAGGGSLNNSSGSNGSPSPMSGSPGGHVYATQSRANNPYHIPSISLAAATPPVAPVPSSTSKDGSAHKLGSGDGYRSTHGISLGISRDGSRLAAGGSNNSPTSSQTISAALPSSPRETSPMSSPQASPRGHRGDQPMMGFARQSSQQDLRKTQASGGSASELGHLRSTSGKTPAAPGTATLHRGPPSPTQQSAHPRPRGAPDTPPPARSAADTPPPGTTLSSSPDDLLRPPSATAPPVSISTHLLLLMAGNGSTTANSSAASTNPSLDRMTAPTVMPSRAGIYIPGPDPLPYSTVTSSKSSTPSHSPSGSSIAHPLSNPAASPRASQSSALQVTSPRTGTKLSLQRMHSSYGVSQPHEAQAQSSAQHHHGLAVSPPIAIPASRAAHQSKAKAATDLALAITLPPLDGPSTNVSPRPSPRPSHSPKPSASPRPVPSPRLAAEPVVTHTATSDVAVSSSPTRAKRVSVRDLVQVIEAAPPAPAPVPIRVSSKGSLTLTSPASSLATDISQAHVGSNPFGTLRRKELPPTPAAMASSPVGALAHSESVSHQRTRSYTKELPALPAISSVSSAAASRPSSGGAVKPLPVPPSRASTQSQQNNG